VGHDPWIIRRDGVSPDDGGRIINALGCLTFAERKSRGGNRYAAHN
jgi:hypothetical protein